MSSERGNVMSLLRQAARSARSAVEGAKAAVAVAGKERGRPAALRLNCDLTNGCNIQCIMCGTKSAAQSFMTLADFRERFVDGFGLVDSFQLGCNYEPLMVPYYDEAVRLIAQRLKPGVKGRSVSNGTLLSARKGEAMIDSDIFENLMFSIDACTPELYEKIRRGARFDRFRSNIAALVRYRNAQGSGSRISFNFTVMPLNIDELPGLVELAAEMGLDAVSTHKLYPDDYAVLERAYHDRIQRNFETAAERAEKCGVAFAPDTSYRSGSTPIPAAAPEARGCSCIDDSVTLTSQFNGELYATCTKVRAPLGNLLKEDLASIVAGNRFQYLLQSFRGAHDGTCSTCPRYMRRQG